MKPFHFKNFTLNQSQNVFRVGTDGVLLGALTSVENAEKILEVGTGTGLIALMLAQRNPAAEITAIDINVDSVRLAEENFQISPFSQRLKILHQDYKKFETSDRFDLIVSNPPYFEKNPSIKDIVARQQTELEFEDLIQKSAKLLSEKGKLSVIIPCDAGNNFEKIAINHQLFANRKIKIFGLKNAAPKRVILEFARRETTVEEFDFTIEKSPRNYSEEYLDLTQDFHLFAQKK